MDIVFNRRDLECRRPFAARLRKPAAAPTAFLPFTPLFFPIGGMPTSRSWSYPPSYSARFVTGVFPASPKAIAQV
jgi:hypothetical protein